MRARKSRAPMTRRVVNHHHVLLLQHRHHLTKNSRPSGIEPCIFNSIRKCPCYVEGCNYDQSSYEQFWITSASSPEYSFWRNEWAFCLSLVDLVRKGGRLPLGNLMGRLASPVMDDPAAGRLDTHCVTTL
jgi:hypothetical protein